MMIKEEDVILRSDEYTKEAISRVKLVLKNEYIIDLRKEELLTDILAPLMRELYKLGAEYEEIQNKEITIDEIEKSLSEFGKSQKKEHLLGKYKLVQARKECKRK